MKSSCLKCNTSNGKTMLLSKCLKCGSAKSRFIKNQEEKELLSNLGIKSPLSKVPILGNIMLYTYKINKIVNKFLLAGDKFMP